MWMWRQVRNYCRRAQLRRMCLHSLRGLHSSLAVAAGCTSSAVAAALGHGSFAITAKHYVDPDMLRNSAARRVAGALTPASSPEDESTRLLERLRSLSPEIRSHCYAPSLLRQRIRKPAPLELPDFHALVVPMEPFGKDCRQKARP